MGSEIDKIEEYQVGYVEGALPLVKFLPQQRMASYTESTLFFFSNELLPFKILPGL